MEKKWILIIIGLIFCIGTISYLLALMNSDQIAFATNPELTAICHSTRDIYDNRTTEERHGGQITLETRFHIYDICTARNGTVISNTSLGYMSFDEWTKQAWANG